MWLDLPGLPPSPSIFAYWDWKEEWPDNEATMTSDEGKSVDLHNIALANIEIQEEWPTRPGGSSVATQIKYKSDRQIQLGSVPVSQ